MSLLCKIGQHDWETLEQDTDVQLKENIEAKIEKKPFPMQVVCESARFLEKKVCLRCHKIIDQITPFSEFVERMYYVGKNRKKLANKILGGEK